MWTLGLRRTLALVVLVLILVWRTGCNQPALRIASFNIEDYPKSRAQELGAFALIDSLGASAIGVQEITDPDRFVASARSYLGPSWSFTYANRGNKWRIGVL